MSGGLPWGGPQVVLLPDGVRLHLHHGPIDLILWADPAGRALAYEAAVARFRTILEELVAELLQLRSAAPVRVEGVVARRMAGLGVDGITTDRPGWLRDRLAGK